MLSQGVKWYFDNLPLYFTFPLAVINPLKQLEMVLFLSNALGDNNPVTLYSSNHEQFFAVPFF